MHTELVPGITHPLSLQVNDRLLPDDALLDLAQDLVTRRLDLFDGGDVDCLGGGAGGGPGG